MLLLKNSQIFFLGCLFFIIGIALEHFWQADIFIIYVVVLSLTTLLTFIWTRLNVRNAFLVLFFFFVGFSVAILAEREASNVFIDFYNNKGEITFNATVAEEPDRRVDHVKIVVNADYLAATGQAVSGKVLIKTPLYPEYFYGDFLEISCQLCQPQLIQDFHYDQYLARYGIYSLCFEPEIKSLGQNKSNWLLGGIFKLKGKIIRLINKIFPEPQASFLGGLLYGARGGIPEGLMDKFNRTGITHIIAISGYNITILAAVSQNILMGLYVSRKKAFWATIFLILFFVIFSGASASVVRAGVMGGLVLLARQSGRLSKVSNVLILTAALMLFFNPKLLFYDAGWQLSFAATIGLVYLSPIFSLYLKRLPEFFGIKESLTNTLSAIILTLPIILFQFGRLSVVAPLANLLVLPVIPLAMATGFAAVVTGFIWLPLGKVLGWVAILILNYIENIAEIFSSFSWSSLAIENFSIAYVVGGYLLIAALMFGGQAKLARERQLS
ncbi:MAG: ComEC/Rec2 family competence protein [Patescibacteria group bacterium]|nr:ComEC/Rec2 family competence protein [Patescibacteria group bacterium]MDD5490173.1 ComEC/Rec2 family competence protein [Patescibacteria group bacterium]